MLFFGRRVNLW